MRKPSPSSASVAALYSRSVRTITDGVPRDVPACVVCHGREALPILQVEGVASPIVQCTSCGLAYYHPMVSLEEIRSFYPQEYYGGRGIKFRPLVERVARLVGRRHITFLSRTLRPGARVLDVGCGRGILLGPLADMGFEVHGVEISEEAALGVDGRAEIRIAPRLADAHYEESYFDEVILWHTLEHLSDPFDTLRTCRRILRPGGRLIVAVPNLSSWQARWSITDWFHLDLPRHLFHFPVAALRRLVERCGFLISSEHHFSLRQNPFGWIQSALNRFSEPRNQLYSFLCSEQRGASGSARWDWNRYRLWALLLTLTPPSIMVSVLAALVRSGATVHVVAHRR